jgi:hypothetical protein
MRTRCSSHTLFVCKGFLFFFLLRLIAPGRASITRCLFRMILRRRDCARSMRESIKNRKKTMSWALDLASVVGLIMPLPALDVST